MPLRAQAATSSLTPLSSTSPGRTTDTGVPLTWWAFRGLVRILDVLRERLRVLTAAGPHSQPRPDRRHEGLSEKRDGVAAV
jgi:hypothetical protein